MKIVFLDFDGVLNSLSDFAFAGGSACFQPAYIGRLNDIVKASQAKIVVSSAWRLNHSLDELREILATSGFQGEIIGCTPIHSYEGVRGFEEMGMVRCQEIQAWIDASPEPLTSFVVLDDLELELLAAYHIHTDMEVGLCDHHVGEALAILG